MALPFLSSSPFLAPRRQLSTRPLYKCCSQTLYIVCHIHTNCRIGLSGPPVPVRVMVGLDPGLLWAPSAETSFDESRQSLSLLISNFEENVNTRPGESAASARVVWATWTTHPLIPSISPTTLCYFGWLGWNRAMIG